MISVLIPVYNFEVISLVTSLSKELSSLNFPYEIILLDDFSEIKYKEKNRKISKIDNVRYAELEENVGRAKIRNKLATKATYEYLLFLDCDSEIPSKTFIQNYVNNITEDTVLHGGTIVTNEYRKDICILRWDYEDKVYSFYRRFPSKRAFTSNNFFITKTVFNQIKFNEEITSYGYEDSVFAIDLKRNGFKIKNMNNPVIHIGLEPNEVYLAKIEASLLNLYKLYAHYENQQELRDEIKLLKFIKILKQTKLIYFIAFLFTALRQKIKNNLLSNDPKIRYFNFYKIAYFCFLNTQSKIYS